MMKKSMPIGCLALCLCLFAAALAGAKPRAGSADRSFGGDGVALLGFGLEPGRGGATDVALQPDGKAVVLMPARGLSMEYSLARFLPDGGIDPSFGSGGYVSGDFGVASSEAVDVAIQPDGKILVGGKQWGTGPARFAVSRYTPAGRLDRGFGGDGTVLEAGDPPFRFGSPNGMVLQPDGKILLAGTLAWEPETQIEVLRLNADGSVDRSYGEGGVARVPIPDAYISIPARALALHEGKLIVAAGGSGGALLARFNADGSLDRSFGGDGTATTDRVGSADELAVQPDGRILLVGDWIVRLLADGSHDPSFGDGGLVRLPAGVSANAISLLGEGRMLLAGLLAEDASSAPRDFALVRLLPDGGLDPTLGAGAGFVATDVAGGLRDEALDLAPLLDGGALLVGESGPSTNPWAFATVSAARYTAAGVLDPSFAADGTLNLQPLRASRDAVFDLLLDERGRVLATGRGAGRIATARFLPSGRLDPSFGDGGAVGAAVTGAPLGEQGERVLRYPDGRLLVGTGSGLGGALLRYLPDGQPDPSFGSGGVLALPQLDRLLDLVRDRRGRVLAIGLSREPCELVMLRLGANGALDPGFGAGAGAGTVRVARLAGACRGHSAALATAPDGRIVAAGMGLGAFVAAYTPAGKRIEGFGRLPNGRSSRALPTRVSDVAVGKNGKIVVAGSFKGAFGLVRLRADGSSDPSFGRGSEVRTPILAKSQVAELRLEPNGKLLAAGTARPCRRLFGCATSSIALARYDRRGALDRGFGRRGILVRQVGLNSGLNAIALGRGTAVLGGWAALSGEDRQFLLARIRR